jgi:hypothetical protein
MWSVWRRAPALSFALSFLAFKFVAVVVGFAFLPQRILSHDDPRLPQRQRQGVVIAAKHDSVAGERSRMLIESL